MQKLVDKIEKKVYNKLYITIFIKESYSYDKKYDVLRQSESYCRR